MAEPPADRLPDTEEKGPELYEKDKGSAQIHGQIFEYKFCALSFLRATNKGYKFKLASNVEGLGAFDDVLVEYIDGNRSKKHIFLQLKSKTKKKITMQQLLAEKGNFSLRKYYESYIKVEKNFNCKEEGVKMDGSINESLFIIYTNTDVAEDLKSEKIIESGEEEFLMTGVSVLQFNEEEHKAIYEHLQDLPKYREFLSRFRICYSQADEEEMGCHIKRELQQSMKLPESELHLTYLLYIDFVRDWWQNCNYFLKDTNSKEHNLLEKTKEKIRPTLLAEVTRLLQCETNVNPADSDGKTPFISALDHRIIKIVRELLTGTAVSDISTRLLSAATEGHIDVVRGLLKNGANVNTSDKDGRTLLYLAGWNGHVELVRELLKYGANVNTARKDGFTPVNVASWTGHVEVVRELLKHGANINTADKDGDTPLYLASQKGHFEVVLELLKYGANVNTASKDGFTPVHVAGQNGHIEVVRELLKHGANVNTADKDGNIPLHMTIFNGHDEVALELLNNGAKVNIANKKGITPLHVASQEGRVNVVRELLKHGANVNAEMNIGFTSLNVAVRNGHDEVVQELKNHGAGLITSVKNLLYAPATMVGSFLPREWK